jgi:hypothetical protein
MKTYRLNAVMAGALYFMGTAFGVLGGLLGGKVFTSLISAEPLEGVDMLALVAADASRMTVGAFFTLLMGLSLAAMTIFLYPVFRKDSEELALGMVLFRGAFEGAWYFATVLIFLVLILLGNEYVATGSNSAALQSMGNVIYRFQDHLGPVGTLMFIVGAILLYLSFYRTRLIPRWLSIWGLVGAAGVLAYALLHYFHLDNGIGFWLQMVIAPQEIVMSLWLVIAGFNKDAVKRLDEAH